MAKTRWTLDPTHSEIYFKVKHLMISTVTGNFGKFSADVETDGDDIATAVVKLTADIDSIDTNNEQRDAHLKNGDFFDAANHPQLHFESSRIVKTGDSDYRVEGFLTMRGVKKPVTLQAEFGGIVTDPWGNTRMGFEISGKISRLDFGISFGAVSETGGVALGNEVKLFANAEFVKVSELQPA